MNEAERIEIAYGKGCLTLLADRRKAEWRIIRPKPELAVPHVEKVFRDACRRPMAARPLRELMQGGGRVVIVTSDGTRAVPNRLLIPWLLEEMGVEPRSVTVLLGNGTHRANTPAEIEGMFGHALARRVRIANHDAFDESRNVALGRTAGGAQVRLDREYVEADRRIVIGFIEPHFFAGFSGGAKGIVPAVAFIDTIMRVHRAELIADPRSTWGVMDENPIQREIGESVAFCPPDFLVNVTLNALKEITGVYAGGYVQAHREGWQRVRETSMAPVDRMFPVVVTSNSGFPLDQNLYQTVKGMSAAARIVAPGGTILVAGECSDGIPAGGNFARLMAIGTRPRDIIDHIYALTKPVLDQWQAQVLAEILSKAEVGIYSKLDAATVESCKLRRVSDLQSAVDTCVRTTGGPVAVLPEGPLTIPYLTDGR